MIKLDTYLPHKNKVKDVPLQISHKKHQLFLELEAKTTQIAVIGLGYVGLPLALHMATTFKVNAIDIQSKKIKSLQLNQDPDGEITSSMFLQKDILFSTDNTLIANSKFVIVAVPTPIDENKKPNLSPLKSATTAVAKHIQKGTVIVFESTVYPGCTEEICVPLLETHSGLKHGEDFFVGYSPERINPGDQHHTFNTITKVVSGCNSETTNLIAQVYQSVILADIYLAPTIKTAEASKVVENIQRDVNIALMNELTYIFDKEDINIHEVIKAASTKWNFASYTPGLVGGHCIGVDPYYLIHRAETKKSTTHLLQTARATNNAMVHYIFRKIKQHLELNNKALRNTSILVRGLTFKENVKDIRNSKVIEIISLFRNNHAHVDLEDPHADSDNLKNLYNLKLTPKDQIRKNYDVVLIAVPHRLYLYANHLKYIHEDGFVFDIKGTFKNQIPKQKYLTV